jgi:hypothetical protein
MNTTKIYEIQDVQLSLLKTNPPKLRIVATGTVPTGAWSEPLLVPFVYIQAPPDGIYDFDFVATPPPPGTVVTQAITKISVEHIVEGIPAGLKGVRIHSSRNAVFGLLNENPSESFEPLPAPSSCRRIDFAQADIVPGIIIGSYFLVVNGMAPCSNMKIDLVPLVYVRCPEYWGIEVVGCLPGGICLTALAPYSVSISLAGITGSQGITVIGANKTERIELQGGCK